jgi:hypothetical protein
VLATGIAALLFALLPYSFWVNGLVAALAFWMISGFGQRYFRSHATPDEIRQDLEDRKNFPG